MGTIIDKKKGKIYMAQGKIIISTEEVKAAAKRVESLAEKYHNSYTELYSIVDSLAGEGFWQGVDNVAFVEQINQFKNDFVMREGIMKAYADFLTKAAEGYKTMQNSIVDQTGKKLVTSV